MLDAAGLGRESSQRSGSSGRNRGRHACEQAAGGGRHQELPARRSRELDCEMERCHLLSGLLDLTLRTHCRNTRVLDTIRQRHRTRVHVTVHPVSKMSANRKHFCGNLCSRGPGRCLRAPAGGAPYRLVILQHSRGIPRVFQFARTSPPRELFRAVWTLGKWWIKKTTYTSQRANHTDPTARSLIEKRTRLGARNSRTAPSSQKRSARREYTARSASSIRLSSEEQ